MSTQNDTRPRTGAAGDLHSDAIQSEQPSPIRYGKSFTMSFVPEEDVLKAKPRTKDEDNWPIIPLVNVTIYDTSHNIANLLTANGNNKLLVQGCLFDLKDVRLTVEFSASKPLPKKVGLTVKDVDRFSYGEFDDGEVALWAAGKAGWFEIEPSTKYKPVYDNMVEALKVYYFVAAKYRDQKPKKREKYIGSAETLFNEYVTFTKKKGFTYGAAAAVFYKHRHFLLTCMITGKEGIVWTRTPMYQYFLKNFPSDIKIARQGGNHQASDDVSKTDAAKKIATPVRRPYQGKSTSTLRPKGTLVSKKKPEVNQEEHDNGSNSENEVTTPTKRKDSPTTNEQPPKRPAPGGRRTRNAANEIAPAPASSPPLPAGLVSVGIKATPIPGTSANGPGDSWTCEIDGCSYKVYDASTDAGKLHIDSHYEGHARIAKRLIELVDGESQRENHSATYLTAFIVEKKSKVAAANPNKKFPKPLVKKY